MMKIGSRFFLIAITYLTLWVLISLSSPFLTSSKPILYSGEDGISFPILNNYSNEDFKNKEDGFFIWPLVSFSSEEIDFQNTGSKSPGATESRKAGQFKHFLGTDHLGRDVLAGLISGARNSFKIITLSLLISLIIGVSLGLIMAYYGDNGLKLSNEIIVLLIALITIFISHLAINQSQILVSLLFWMALVLILYLIQRRFNFFKKKYLSVPIDLFFSRAIEVFDSIPKILLLLAIFAGFLPSLAKVIVLIALINWPEITKITRAEALSEKNKHYVESGKALGYSNFRIIFIHILPNIIGPITVYLAFNAGYILLLESSLSFLGLGVPADVITWGRMLAIAKNHLNSWWLVIFPGFFIFATVYSLNVLGRHLRVRI